MDGCPLRPFASRKASHGFTISLFGRRFCNYDRVLAVASDADGNTRLVATWSVDPTSGLYILRQEHGRNPPGWLDLTCSALPI